MHQTTNDVDLNDLRQPLSTICRPAPVAPMNQRYAGLSASNKQDSHLTARRSDPSSRKHGRNDAAREATRRTEQTVVPGEIHAYLDSTRALFTAKRAEISHLERTLEETKRSLNEKRAEMLDIERNLDSTLRVHRLNMMDRQP